MIVNLQILLNKCGEFEGLWRINFNPTKSVIICQNWSKNEESRDLYLNGVKIQKEHSLVYLGFPIEQEAPYSLNGVDCRAFCLEPKVLARLFIFCRSMNQKAEHLNIYFNKSKCSEGSFIQQIKDVGKLYSINFVKNYSNRQS
ncbi:hypothetical protein BpHYR1_026848 [Brachionus plicatilis]|uniref:RNA-directed DNA polymerase from mobile element jockey-like n=1 Tax=Brachionus plicatilis TaxID=10195 RepID=A0A3M7S6X0_BRAPC|nr:hypothetical protein BpHYR1_026848 [Brachionus plicatilis]